MLSQFDDGSLFIMDGVQDTGGKVTFCGDLRPILPVKVQSRLSAFALQLAGEEEFDEVTPPVILISWLFRD
jgi:hypothetical protein